jgi:O-antigen/teichoic acid export membrane protein
MVTLDTTQPLFIDPAVASNRSPTGAAERDPTLIDKVSYRPRHVADKPPGMETGPNGSALGVALRPRGRHAANTRVNEDLGRAAPAYNHRGAAPERRAVEEDKRQRQLAGLNALLSLASPTVATGPILEPRLVPIRRPGALRVLRDPALRGALALMFSAVMAGGLGFVFWSLTAHRQGASAVGSVAAEVSAITVLASVGSLNLINVFARFLPEAGWHSRRLVITSYGGAALTGLLAATVFLLTPFASGLVLGGGFGRLAFAICVVLNSVFMIQDGGLIGFGRFSWVPVENILVASARLALLPLAAAFLSAPIGALWSWALPMAVAVVVVNLLIIGPLAGQQKKQRPNLPTVGELGRFIAIESVTTAVSSAVSAFLPALVTERLGANQGGYFYVPWIIATMVSLLLSSILISMVREAVANPEKADFTIGRSMRLALLVVIVGMAGCLFLSKLILAPLGPDFAAHGAPLLRWVGLALPATAVNLLFWATCLVRRRPWPVLMVNLTTSSAIVGGVLLLGRSADIDRVGIVYCSLQWAVAAAVSLATVRGLRVVRQNQIPQRQVSK